MFGEVKVKEERVAQKRPKGEAREAALEERAFPAGDLAKVAGDVAPNLEDAEKPENRVGAEV